MDGSQGYTIGISLEMVLRMNFKGPMLVLFNEIQVGDAIFVIKSKDFHVEIPFFSKKRMIFRGEIA